MDPKTNDFDSSDSLIPKATDQPIQINEPSVTEPEPTQPKPVNEDTGALIQNMDELIPGQSQSEDQMAKDINDRIAHKNKLRKIITIVIVFLIVLAVAVAIIVAVLMKESEKAAKFKDDARTFAVKIRELRDSKSIYYLKTYGPKVEIYKSPYNRNYTNSSYVTNYYNHVYVCLSDGQHRAMGYIDEEITLDEGSKCEYEFQDHSKLDDAYDYDEKRAYLTQYAQTEYKYLDEFLQSGDLLDICEYYVRRYYDSTDIGDLPVYQIFIAKSDLYYVRMLSNLDYETGEKFMQELKSYAEKHKIPMKNKVIDLSCFYTEESSGDLKPLYYIVLGQKASTGEYIIIPQVFN